MWFTMIFFFIAFPLKSNKSTNIYKIVKKKRKKINKNI